MPSKHSTRVRIPVIAYFLINIPFLISHINLLTLNWVVCELQREVTCMGNRMIASLCFLLEPPQLLLSPSACLSRVSSCGLSGKGIRVLLWVESLHLDLRFTDLPGGRLITEEIKLCVLRVVLASSEVEDVVWRLGLGVVLVLVLIVAWVKLLVHNFNVVLDSSLLDFL